MQTSGRETVAIFGPAFILTLVALALWGFGHRLYATLLPDLANAVLLSPAEANMARAAIMIGYFVMALPTACISRNFGCKVGALMGLGLFAVGMFLFHPAVDRHSFFLLLFAATVIGSGLAVIQITMAPVIVFLGTKKNAITRMTFAQAFTPLGTLAGVYVAQCILDIVASTGASDAGHSLVYPLSVMGGLAIALAFALELSPFPDQIIARSPANESTWSSLFPPLRNTRFRLAVIAQLFSLSAQVVAASYAMGFTQSAMPAWTIAEAEHWCLFGIALMAVGRFAGAALMWRFDPIALVVVFSAASVLCAAVASFAPGMIGIWALVAMCLFLSLQMPVFLAHALVDLDEMAKSGAAIMMFVAFSGAGVIGLGVLLTIPLSVHAAMIVPALCFGASTYCAVALWRAERAESARLPSGASGASGPAAVIPQQGTR